MTLTRGRYQTHQTLQTTSDGLFSLAIGGYVSTGEAAMAEARVFVRGDTNAFHLIRGMVTQVSGLIGQTSSVIYDSKGTIGVQFIYVSNRIRVELDSNTANTIDWEIQSYVMVR